LGDAVNLIVYKKYLIGFLQFIMDAVVLTVSFLLAYLLKKFLIFPDPQLSSVAYLRLFIVIFPFLMATLYFTKLYTLGVILQPWGNWVKTAARSVIHMFIMLIVLSFYLKMFSYSRLVFTLFLFIFTPSLIISKVIFNRVFMRSILNKNQLFNKIAFFTDQRDRGIIDKIRRLHGCSVDEVNLEGGKILRTSEINRICQGVTGGVLVDLDNSRYEEIAAIFEKANLEGVSVYLSPRSVSHYKADVSMEKLGDQALFAFYPSHIPGYGWVLKRSVDLILSSLAIVLLSPVMVTIVCAIRLTSPGPAVYRQTRVGFGGGLFTMFKFRTMDKDAEAETGPVWASENDSRVTRVGRFLRRTNLDELPQLFNVLVGDMSLVGPRPERPEFVARFKDEIKKYSHKHWVRPGITGWAQINGWRGNTSLAERIKCDLFYIENWSLWTDLKILVYTLFKTYKNAM